MSLKFLKRIAQRVLSLINGAVKCLIVAAMNGTKIYPSGYLPDLSICVCQIRIAKWPDLDNILSQIQFGVHKSPDSMILNGKFRHQPKKRTTSK